MVGVLPPRGVKRLGLLLLAVALVGCTGSKERPGATAPPASAHPMATFESVRFGCGPTDGPYVSGVVHAPAPFVGFVEVLHGGTHLGSGEVRRYRATSELSFGVDLLAYGGPLPITGQVVLRATGGGPVLDQTDLVLRMAPGGPTCG